MNSNYASGPASSFASAARKPIYEGQTCFICKKAEGKLLFAGYDEELGDLWAHPDCQKENPGIECHTPYRTIAMIEFTCQKECYVGIHFIGKGTLLTGRNLNNGLWALSYPGKELREFAQLNSLDINKLAGFELMEVL